MRKFIIQLFIATLFVFGANGQDFEGTITYKITYLKVPAEVEGMESMLPTHMEMKFKGDEVKLEQEVMGGSQIVISNNQDSTGYILMDMMGQKLAIAMTKESMIEAEEETKEPEIEYLKETKKVAGYKCKKIIVKNTDGTEVEGYYTSKINKVHNEFKGLKGMPLSYETKKDGMHLKVEATSVTEEVISKDEFVVPSDYTHMTMDELQQMMGN